MGRKIIGLKRMAKLGGCRVHITNGGVRLSSAVNLKWTDIDFEKHICLLRHTFATLYLQKGGRAEKLQKILGHKTADMTQRYVHYVTDDLVEDIDDFTF